MEELRIDVQELMEDELERANGEFPLFRSDHEGIGVIREELGEGLEEMKSVAEIEADLEQAVFKDKTIREKHAIARQGVIAAVACACEMIQTAAMFDKFRTSMDKRRQDEKDPKDQEDFDALMDLIDKDERVIAEKTLRVPPSKVKEVLTFLEQLESEMEEKE